MRQNYTAVSCDGRRQAVDNALSDLRISKSMIEASPDTAGKAALLEALK